MAQITHIFQWVAIYHDNDTNRAELLYQFDERSEHYDKTFGLIPFVKVVLDILNKEGRLHSFHLIPNDGSFLETTTYPRFTVDLITGEFQLNGQVLKLFPIDISLFNFRLIHYFSPVRAVIDGEPFAFIRLYKLGLQANDVDGKNYQKVMIWNSEDQSISIQDNR